MAGNPRASPLASPSFAALSRDREATTGDLWQPLVALVYTADVSELDTAEPGYKALTLLALSVHPQVFDPAKLSSDKIQCFLLATAMQFRYSSFETQSVLVFTRQGGISCVDRLRVCTGTPRLRGESIFFPIHLFRPDIAI